MPKLFALLVGINQYHPDSHVDNLYGCVNDVRTMDAFLRTQFSDFLQEPDLQIKILLNEAATREDLINDFSKHLGKAGEKDYALFYYSGHGSFEETSKEFRAMDGQAKNETLVCYDSRLPGRYDLADKELAVLINGLSDQAQKIIILDSCHSGSATRSMEEVDFGRRRQAPAKRHASSGESTRPLTSYLLSKENYYTELLKQGQALKVPESVHLLLSACNKDETALETTSGRGLFSYHLIKTLTEYNTKISYKDLFVQIRAAIQQSRAGQTPQLEPIGAFNPHYRFLSKDSVDAKKYLVKWVDHSFDKSRSHWSLELGAVHGFPTDAQEIGGISLRLKPTSDETSDNPGIPATIKSVSLNESVLELQSEDTSATFRAEIVNLPLSLSLWTYLSGEDSLKATFKELYHKHPSAYLQFEDQPGGCRYELQLRDQRMFLYHRPSKKFIIGSEGLDAWNVEEMVKNLHKIEKWERIKKIHKQAEHLDTSKIVFKCEELGANGQAIHEAVEDQITLTLEKNGDKWKHSKLSIKVENQTERSLFALVLFMGRHFDIMALKNVELPANGEAISLFLHELTISDPNLLQVVDFVKVIVSTAQLSPENFVQEKMKVGTVFSKTRFGAKAVPDWKAAPKSDWFTRTFVVTLSGNVATVGPQTITEKGITISPHALFTAKLSFAPIQAYNLDKNVINHLPDLLRNAPFEIINFSEEQHGDDQSVVILTEVSNADKLMEAPLEITLSSVEAGQTVFPISYDGKLLLPFGEILSKQPGKTILHCSYLPAKSFPQRKDQTSTIQFCLLKTVLPTTATPSGLNWFNYEMAQKDRRTQNDLKEKIAKANQILLLLPGLFNDSVEMGNALQFAHEDKSIDLVLTFDYNPAEISIADAAQQLQEALSANGLAAGHTKKIKIIAHASGCLIARHWLEILGHGQKWAEKALFIAPPNKGLESDDIKSHYQRALAFAFNFQPAYVLSLLSKIEQIKQHSPDNESNVYTDLQPNSSLLQQLADTASVAAPYQIIAGDLSDFPTNSEQEIMAGLKSEMDKMLGSSGKEQPKNDGTVSINSAFDIPFVPADQKTTVPCIHYHFFEDGATLAKVSKWLEG